ncbi:hypothetical protein [Candidatus Pantoea bituminis]|uniref:hypothetical protein n=1 Tax=Candidatus Pantoea bituminis TaxID=2831036 RepID=UPI001C063062|nr:hypothetical protein [Pantoea bituminis]
MYNNNEAINYLQANKILALKLDHELAGVGKAVSNQIETIGAGATRVLYYLSAQGRLRTQNQRQILQTLSPG